MKEFLYLVVEEQCIDKSFWNSKSTLIHHPNGAMLELTFKPNRFGRTNVPNVVTSFGRTMTHANDICFATNSLVEKNYMLLTK